MDTVFEININVLLDIISFCMKNRNNNVLSNMYVDIKNNIENSHYFLLNDTQKDLLKLSFLKSAKSHKVIYNKKYNVFIKDYNFNGNNVLILSMVNMDNIKTFVLFNEKYVNVLFKKFLMDTKNLYKENIFINENYKNIPTQKRVENILYHRQKENYTYIHRNKDSQIKLRNKLNKRYDYLSNYERKLLNKRDNKKGTFNNESYITFIESMETMEVELEELKDSLEFIEDMEEYYKVINQIDLLEYDLKEKQKTLNKDIKENIFYSNINY